MSQAEIADILRAHLNVMPSDWATAWLEETRKGQPEGNRHCWTITGVEKAAAAIAEKLK